MGSQVIAICKCGTNMTISIGGGRLNHHAINYFPSLCPSCHNIVQTNLRDKTLKCPECKNENTIPYNNSKVIGIEGENVIARSSMDILTDGTYYCPYCESMTLHFKRGYILWD